MIRIACYILSARRERRVCRAIRNGWGTMGVLTGTHTCMCGESRLHAHISEMSLRNVREISRYYSLRRDFGD